MTAKLGLGPFYRGDTCEWKIEFADEDDVPLNITGWRIYLTFKEDRDSADFDATLQLMYTMQAGADATAGRAYLHVASKFTALLDSSRYWWDIQIVKPDGVIQTIGSGTVSVKKDLTRESA